MKKLVILLLLFSGCTTNRAIVQKASATATYYTASYEHKCQNTGGNPPEQCKHCQALINDAVWKIRTAENTKDQGYMPPVEVIELQQLTLALQQCP